MLREGEGEEQFQEGTDNGNKREQNLIEVDMINPQHLGEPLLYANL